MRLGFLTRDGRGYSLDGGSGCDAVLMPRTDVEVHVFDLPPVGEREARGIVALRLRRVYPGSPAGTTFDLRLARGGRARRAVAVVSRTATVDACRAAAGRRPLVLPFQVLAGRVPRRGSFRAWVVHGGWVELLAFRDGVLVSSTVRRLERVRAAGLAAMERALPRDLEDGPRLVAASAQTLGHLDGIERTGVVILDELCRREKVPEGLFPAARPPAGARRSARRLALAAVTLMLAAAVFSKYVTSVEDRAERLSVLAREMVRDEQRLVEARRELDRLRLERDRLRSTAPPDPYRFLATLVPVLAGRARIVGLALKDDAFRLDVVGSDPLGIMERFAAGEEFSALKLSPVVPDGVPGRERFAISGAYRAR